MIHFLVCFFLSLILCFQTKEMFVLCYSMHSKVTASMSWQCLCWDELSLWWKNHSFFVWMACEWYVMIAKSKCRNRRINNSHWISISLDNRLRFCYFDFNDTPFDEVFPFSVVTIIITENVNHFYFHAVIRKFEAETTSVTLSRQVFKPFTLKLSYEFSFLHGLCFISFHFTFLFIAFTCIVNQNR